MIRGTDDYRTYYYSIAFHNGSMMVGVDVEINVRWKFAMESVVLRHKGRCEDKYEWI